MLDSEASVARFLADRLSEEHDVAALTDAREALHHLRSRAHYDVILCDMHLEGMSGLEFLSELTGISCDAADRVVFTAEEPTARRASAELRSRGRPCLERPVDVRQVRRLVRERLWKERLFDAPKGPKEATPS